MDFEPNFIYYLANLLATEPEYAFFRRKEWVEIIKKDHDQHGRFCRPMLPRLFLSDSLTLKEVLQYIHITDKDLVDMISQAIEESLDESLDHLLAYVEKHKRKIKTLKVIFYNKIFIPKGYQRCKNLGIVDIYYEALMNDEKLEYEFDPITAEKEGEPFNYRDTYHFFMYGKYSKGYSNILQYWNEIQKAGELEKERSYRAACDFFMTTDQNLVIFRMCNRHFFSPIAMNPENMALFKRVTDLIHDKSDFSMLYHALERAVAFKDILGDKFTILQKVRFFVPHPKLLRFYLTCCDIDPLDLNLCVALAIEGEHKESLEILLEFASTQVDIVHRIIELLPQLPVNEELYQKATNLGFCDICYQRRDKKYNPQIFEDVRALSYNLDYRRASYVAKYANREDRIAMLKFFEGPTVEKGIVYQAFCHVFDTSDVTQLLEYIDVFQALIP